MSTWSDKAGLGQTMTSDDKKTKTDPTPKSEVRPEKKSTSGPDLPKADGGEPAADSPSG
jgi:hypothetical protein